MRRPDALPRPLVLALLFAGAALLSAITILQGVQPNDEGLMLQAAQRIADGQVPYSDFWWYYPPGQPYLLAGLWDLFGPSLVVWRVVRVLTDAGVAVLAYELARRRAPGWLPLGVWLAAACAMAFPSQPHPFPIALALALGALIAVERRPLLAGVLLGACAAWRLEFAAYAGLGIAIAHVVSSEPGRARITRLGRLVAAAVATGAALYLPVVLAAGVGRSWEMLVEYPVLDFGDYQSLPFPLDYDGPLNTTGPGGFISDSAENLIHFYLPLALAIGLAGGLLALALRLRRADPWPVATAVFAIGMGHYLLVRADIFHTAPLAVMVAILAAWALAASRAPRAHPSAETGQIVPLLNTPGEPKSKASPIGTQSTSGGAARRAIALAATAAATLGFAWALAEGIDRRVRGLTDEDTVALDLPVADGVRARPPRALALERAARYVREHVPEGEPIYVTTKRSDLVTSGNPLLYVLAERPNVTRYDIAAPGVVTSAPVQREIVADLRRERPLVVRWIAPITAEPEPNRAGESSGVRILDDYLEREYRQVAKLGYYVMLEPAP
ncbi:MAG TPA: hypothetical protein VF517_12450 [Thermoleophilaceae bacterium]